MDKVYFAVKQEGYDYNTVFGPFTKRRTAANFIEKDEDNNEFSPWWTDDWSILEKEVVDDWNRSTRLCYTLSNQYRPKYCKEQRRIRYEQRRKKNKEG